MGKVKKEAARKQYPCLDCGTVLSSSYNLKIHNETKCSTEKNFICEVCDSKFLTQHSLKTHRNSLHFGEKKFECSWCGNKYLSKGQLKVHVRSHTKEKSFVCGVCKKGFSHRESLVTHSTIHSGIKPYICECCSSTFSCVGNLIKHRKVRPGSCGQPIYTNKKICKRTGVKCVGSSPKIVVNTEAEAPVKREEEYTIEEVVYDTEIIDTPFQDPLSDHQYISFDNNQTTQDEHVEDYANKEMDVFDYIGIEIKNIQEQEEREKQLQNQKEDESTQEMIIEEEFYIDPNEIIEEEVNEETLTTFFVEEVNFITSDELSEELNNYITIVEGKNFQCKLCPRIYQKQNVTVKHLKNEHQIILKNYIYDNTNRYRKPQKDLNWKCRFCPKKYTSKTLVVRHEKVHGPEGNLLHKCSCCSKHFETETEMEEHQYFEHEDRLVCQEENCGKRFDHPEKLVGHKKYAHLNGKSTLKKYNLVCQLCGRNFNTLVALSDHERSSCGKAPIYQCSFCKNNYHSAGSLKCHMTIHTNTLDYECSYCSKKFRTKGQLTVHLRSHTKEKNYKCSHCPAEFSHRESLLTHNTLHTGIKRFSCSSCDKGFSCISNLLAHRKSHKNTCGNSQINKVSNAENSVRMCTDK